MYSNYVYQLWQEKLLEIFQMFIYISTEIGKNILYVPRINLGIYLLLATISRYSNNVYLHKTTAKK